MATTCRGIRGAITADANTQEAILSATRELFQELVKANTIQTKDVAAVFLTTTADLNAEFPAVALRQMGWTRVPMLCAHEMQVPDGLPRCIRAMVLVNTEKAPEALEHVYLRGAVSLRDRGVT
jgi:chorismate mutase